LRVGAAHGRDAPPAICDAAGLLARCCALYASRHENPTRGRAVPRSPFSFAQVEHRAQATPSDTGTAAAVAAGDYECWAFGEARMLLNFTVTGTGTYRASDDSVGTFTYDAATGIIVFTGYLADSMPSGFTAKYYEPKGTPTVSFRGRGGAEASFCEKA
jgi:hypothetical protein